MITMMMIILGKLRIVKLRIVMEFGSFPDRRGMDE